MDETEDVVIRPRFIDTEKYVKDRIEQIADLLEVRFFLINDLALKECIKFKGCG